MSLLVPSPVKKGSGVSEEGLERGQGKSGGWERNEVEERMKAGDATKGWDEKRTVAFGQVG